jgi:hypothetical protein
MYLVKYFIFSSLFTSLLLASNWLELPNSVVDTKHKLQWQDTKALQEYEEKWKMAKAHCQGLTLEGFHDWRIPTQNELITLSQSKEGKRVFRYIDSQIFWAKEEDADDPVNAFTIYIGNGHSSSNDKCETNNIMCVRDNN